MANDNCLNQGKSILSKKWAQNGELQREDVYFALNGDDHGYRVQPIPTTIHATQKSSSSTISR